MTTREQALIDEITATGGYEVTDESEDAFLQALVDEGFEDDVEAARAALEDMGEDPSDWIGLD